MIERPAIPPTTPPAIAPTLDFEGVGVGEGEDVEDEAVVVSPLPPLMVDEVVGSVVRGLIEVSVEAPLEVGMLTDEDTSMDGRLDVEELESVVKV
jgi:hypothetical protein